MNSCYVGMHLISKWRKVVYVLSGTRLPEGVSARVHGFLLVPVREIRVNIRDLAPTKQRQFTTIRAQDNFC